MNRSIIPCAMVVACVSLAGCGKVRDAVEPRPLEDAVYTTFYPTTYLATRLLADAVPVICPLPADQDPVTWQPSRETLVRYQGARLIVLNGASFEKWVETSSLPQRRLLESALGFSERFVTTDMGMMHSHGGGTAHSHGGIDGHTWLDPKNAAAQASSIALALQRTFPRFAESIRRNATTLSSDLERLHARWQGLAPRLKQARVLASHPAYNYLASRYDFAVKNFDLNPETPLTPPQVEELRTAGGGNAILLWEAEPLAENLTTTRSLGIRNVVLTPCEHSPVEGDFLRSMDQNLDRLSKALQSL